MPDISMCKDKECKAKEHCYRFTAIPDGWQSYFSPGLGAEARHVLLTKKTKMSKTETSIPCCSYFYANAACKFYRLEKIKITHSDKPLTISDFRRP